ncbi:type II toxin-antitoxin system RelE/ParE family toxin [Marinilabiliaceae bacterium JC017]|nr:type II toxin-antitoxin system RelE/ParE family toxin [Marinilabiliaceae bacterium JC017]
MDIKFLKEEVSEETAEYVRRGIITKCKSLKDFAGYSKESYLEDEPKEYRSVSHWNYNIIYTVTKDEVRILNIIHTSRHPFKRTDI